MTTPRLLVMLVTWLSFSGQGIAQSPYIDSLKKVLPNAQDTTRVNILNRLASAFWYIDPQITIQYATEGVAIAEQIGFGRGLASACNNVGVGYYQQNKYDEAINWYQKAIEAHKKNNNYTGEGHVLSNIGLIYWKQGQLSTAVEYYLKSLEIWDKYKIEDEKSGVYDNIGNVYNEQEDFDRALEYYFKALAIQDKYGMENHFRSMTHSNAGTAYLGKGKLDSALHYFFTALDFLDEEEKESRGVALSNIGLAYVDKKMYDSALSYLTRAIDIQEEYGDTDGMLHTLVGLAKSHKELRRIPESSVIANRALTLAKQINDNNILEQIYLILSELAVAQGNYREAYNNYVKYVAARDSIKSTGNIYDIAHLQANFETQKKQALIDAMQAEQKQLAFRRNTIVAGLVALLVIATLIASRQRLKIKNNQQLQEINNQLTEQSKRLEQQTKKLQELDQVKSTFFANISHEFRTPLTLILNSLNDRIATIRDTDAGQLAQLEVMNRNARRLLNLINQLLDLSKLDAGKMKLSPESCDLRKLLSAACGSFSSLAISRQITFTNRLPEPDQICRLDIDKTEKIVYNLLSNAFKYTPIGGKIHFDAVVEDEQIKIFVQDSGNGIAPDQIEKIFDRFYQGHQYHSDEQGTGIGLALTKELVELHKGKIYAENHEQGARFAVQLPFVPAEEPASADYSSSSPAKIIAVPAAQEIVAATIAESDENRNTILIVEDNEDLREYIRKTLVPEFDVLTTDNGKAGLNAAYNKIPDLVISDWMMPEMDGITLCAKLKGDERTSHIPIILLTALASDDAKLKGLETGADDYLTKPFDSRELMVRVRNRIESRRMLREKFSKELHLAPKKVQVSSMDQKFLDRVMETVETYMGDPDFDMEKFGQQVGLSRMQLHRKLKAITGQTPGDFLRIMRLKRAKQLLEAKSGNVSEVAYEVGFNNLSYFSKCYREQYNMSPNETFSQHVTKVPGNVTDN